LNATSNSNKNKRYCALFINPHPDDTEFTSASTCMQMVLRGWKVYEILMTSDEYGTERDDFKGKRIKRIRIHEMEEAAKTYGVDEKGDPKIKLIWFGEIDGHLHFNSNVFKKLKDMIKKINPDIIIAPDSFFSMDLHPDHKHTGWLVYLAVKSIIDERNEKFKIFKQINSEKIKKYMKQKKKKKAIKELISNNIKPILLLYHSFKPNFFIEIKDLKIQIKAWSKHKSQTTPLLNKLLFPARKLFYFLRRTKTGAKIGEGFRLVVFQKDENKIKSFKDKILYYFFAKGMKGYGPERYTPTPKELGLI